VELHGLDVGGPPRRSRNWVLGDQGRNEPFPEVAQRLGRTVDSVKKIWPRALAGLRRELKGETP